MDRSYTRGWQIVAEARLRQSSIWRAKGRRISAILRRRLKLPRIAITACALSSAIPIRAARLARFSPASLLHAIHLYGAAAVTAFGWGVCGLLDWDAAPWAPLWFCGALLIYNADRLRHDPADTLNVPERECAAGRFRAASAFTTAAAAVVLVATPIVRGDWITLALVVLGAVVCLNYSVPAFGFRLKDVPVLKTFVAPTIVAAAVLVLPWIHEGPPANRVLFAVVAVRAWGLLLFNMILCDLRDVEGDLRTGVTSLPGALGWRGTRRVLAGLLVTLESLAFIIVARLPDSHPLAWRILCLIGPLYLGWLIIAARVRRSERFYEWWVEGMFFLPAIAVAVEAALD